jgi:hypothetical protein
MKKEIFGLTPEELQQEFVAAGLKKFRASPASGVFLAL